MPEEIKVEIEDKRGTIVLHIPMDYEVERNSNIILRIPKIIIENMIRKIEKR